MFKIAFICREDPKKFSFSLYFDEVEIETLTFEMLLKSFYSYPLDEKFMQRELRDVFGNKYNLSFLELYGGRFLKEPISYILDLVPFTFSLISKANKDDGDFQIFLNGKVISVSSDWTIDTLELIAEELFCYDQPIYITNGCRHLDWFSTIGSNVSKESHLFARYRLTGGGSGRNFVDISKECYQDLNFSKTAPDWRICYNGLNIEGKCCNSQCSAYLKQVICPMDSIKVFDLISNIDLIVCPICKKTFEPLTCGFSNCEYTWSGIKVDTDNMIKKYINQEWNYIGKHYRLFNPLKSGVVTWKSLKIIVRINYNDTDYTDARLKFCGFCGEKESKDSNVYKFDCTHFYHKECFKRLGKCIIC